MDAGQWENYLEKQFSLIGNLPSHIYKNTYIRIYPKAEYEYSQTARWKDKFKTIKIDSCRNNLIKQLEQTRICISNTTS